MNTSAAIADTLLRPAFGRQARSSDLRCTVGDWRRPRRNGKGTAADGGASPPGSAISQRTVM